MEAPQDLTSRFTPYMPGVSRYEGRLTSLTDAWDQIKRLAEVNCPEEAKTILPSMEKTQKGFDELRGKLIPSLVLEELHKVTLELGSKAQVAVDIVIRNLFERTADVGFLATDADIVEFLRRGGSEPGEVASVTARLGEYRDKYTVYDEIVVLDARGVVRAHLDEESPIEESEDPLIARTMQEEGYLETFRKSDLRPRQDKALIYSHRIQDPADGNVLGVLCLCFRFEDEMQGVFRNLRREGDKSVMLLLDGKGRVIASSDENHVRLGTAMETVVDEEWRVVEFAGREYLAVTRPTKGYQGFMGLGWLGHVMVPCDQAFRKAASQALERVDRDVLDGLMRNSQSFSVELSDIAERAADINLSLRRVVWNGQVMSKDEGSRLKSVLRQISKTGGETSNVFADSIANLHETVISSSLDDTMFMSRLAVDVMDRNLYERANDCRWWALASAFRATLAKGVIGDEDIREMTSILEYVNSLYTVYTRLFVYDRDGVILAASDLHGEGPEIVGRRLDGDYVRRTFELTSTQEYRVSPFEPSDLYAHRPTYIYSAAIRSLSDPREVVGGIGVVFDAEPQFEAMLRDSIPEREGVFAVFAERGGRIVSSTDPDHPVGSRLDIPREYLEQKNGQGRSGIIEHRGHYYSVGSTTSFGYREYKVDDDYVNDVAAVVFVRLGDACDGKVCVAPVARGLSIENGHDAVRGPRREFATFYVGDRRYGLDARKVEESVGLERLTDKMPGACAWIEGVLDFRGSPVAVLRTREIFGLPPRERAPYAQVVVARTSEGLIGLLVDDLDDVPEVDAERVAPVPSVIACDAGFTSEIVRPRPGDEAAEMLLVLDPDRILFSVKCLRASEKKNGHAVAQAKPSRASGLSGERAAEGLPN